MRNPIPTLVYAALFALGGFILAPPARAQHNTPLNDSDKAIMLQLATSYGWGPVFGWNDADPCNWPGIICIRGQIHGIAGDCEATKLNGQIPPILSELPALTQLKISACGLWGPIPDSFAALTALSQLQLNSNALSGPFPTWFANLPNLGFLDLGHNRFTGAIVDPSPDPGSCQQVNWLEGNFFSSISPSWTRFNRDVSYSCVASPPASSSFNPCSNPTTPNYCAPQRQACFGVVSLSQVSGDGQRTQVNAYFANPLQVLVTDLSGNPQAGQMVTFSGPGIVTATGTSNSNGVASAIIQANSTLGGNTVAATVGGAIVTFGLTNGTAASCLASISVTSTGDSGAGTLRQALADVCPGGTVDMGPIAGQTIALSAGLGSYNFSGRLYIGDSVTVVGHGVTISGSGNTRIFFVQGGNVLLENLTLANGLGQGGSSQYGGPAAGMGGAIFQNDGTLTLSGVTLSNNTAQGGSTDSSGTMAGGGFGANSSGGDLGGTVGPQDGAGGIADGFGDPGGFGAGGGVANATDQSRGLSPFGQSSGGVGGFGGSGGAVMAPNTDLNNGFQGGYGGGAASASGGAGFGGAIFVRAGTLGLAASSFSGNRAIGGTGAQGKGGAIFVYNGAVLNMDAATTFSGSVAAAAGGGGQNYSDMTYHPGALCPGVDNTNICGVIPANTLTVTVSGPGSVSDSTNLIQCPAATCSAQFQGTVMLIAAPTGGSSFSGWTGACSGTGTCTVSLAGGSASVGASFVPAVTNVSSTNANGPYGLGKTVNITVTFSSAVTVTGTPQLALNSGGTANYVSGSGATLTFSYVVGAGQSSAHLDYSSTSALTLNGGTIMSGGTPAALTLPSPGAAGSLSANKSISIDTAAPTVVSYAVQFGSESFTLGSVARTVLPWEISGITVVFSKPVTATVASLTGVAGSAVSGSRTSTITWTLSSPLMAVTANTAVKGTGVSLVTDLAGNPLGGGVDFPKTLEILWGDYNGDAVVSASDTVLVNGQVGQPYNIFADLNGDGVVNAADVLITRQRTGTKLPQ